MQTSFKVSPEGYYGNYGGMHVPEILRPAIEALAGCYARIIESDAFQHEFRTYLREYAGRPTLPFCLFLPSWPLPSVSCHR